MPTPTLSSFSELLISVVLRGEERERVPSNHLPLTKKNKMTTTTTTQTLDIVGHLYNLDEALHEGGDKAVTAYETGRLLTDYTNGLTVRVFDSLEDENLTNWNEVESVANYVGVEFTPELVGDIRSLCEDTISISNNDRIDLTPGENQRRGVRWVAQSEALLAS